MAGTPAGDAATPNGDAAPGPVAREQAQPQEAGLLSGGLALDMGAVQGGVQAFLDQLDRVGAALTSVPGGVGLYWWLLTTAAAGAGCEVARRHLKPAPRLAFGPGDPLFSWDTSTDQLPEGQP